MNTIKYLDYDKYNKYLNQKYLDEKKFEIIPTIFVFLCSCYLAFKLMPHSHTYFSVFLCLAGFYYCLQNILHLFLFKKIVLGVFFLDNKLALKFSKFQYEYLENIEKIAIHEITPLNRITLHYAYDTISISGNNKQYFIPYNEEYKDELIKLLSIYQNTANKLD